MSLRKGVFTFYLELINIAPEASEHEMLPICHVYTFFFFINLPLSIIYIFVKYYFTSAFYIIVEYIFLCE